MTTPRLSRSALAATAAALGALGAIGVAQLAGGASPVMQIVPAQASSDADTDKATTGKDGQVKADKAEKSGKAAKERCRNKEPLDQESRQKAEAAALEAVPGATVRKVHRARADEGYKVLLLKSDGTTRVLVHEDAAFKVTKVDDPAPDRPKGGRGHGRGEGQDPGVRRGTTPTTTATNATF